MLDNEETVKIFTLEREHEYLLPLIRETFDKEQIEFHIRSEYDTAYDGVYIGQKGVAHIYVFQKDKERAQEILMDIINSCNKE
jgi:hypothetical protein